ncbi:ribonuclease E domain-containing protein [Rhizobium gallicum bv. gallicum R602sp]|uniref:Ribonuclease E domain-containing protein n=1 Tax=Rhizobium gallicum bv. gallicum R602sp TaxID=1041138 RepID=A0A0B4X2I5_9HYPH|nr:hypothetical protein [Rhizobium gallicum]AJD42289.1 ribonuclease E domain-containing protein [Rhizobium gallicum bv. gallicum R602sp]
MADFIAVIRRAVDGLAENTPEMRTKVYERARGAVQRQLENMKPRPPEAMLQRQLDKLDAAIREVEAEHSEALPDDEAAIAAADAPVHEEPVSEPSTEYAVAPEPAEEPVAGEPVADEPVAAELADEPVAAEPVAEEHRADADEEAQYRHEEPQPEPQEEAAPYEEPHEEPASVAAVPEEQEEERWDRPVEEVTAAAEAEAAPPEEWAASHRDEVPVDEYALPPEEYLEDAPAVEAEPAVEPEPLPPAGEYNPSNRLVEPFVSFEKPEEFVEHSREEPLRAETVAHFDPVWAEPAAETPAEPPKDAEVEWATEEVRNFSESVPQAESANDHARAFEEAIAGLQNPPPPAKMPAANQGFSWEAAAFDDLPPIEAGTNNKKAPVAAHFDDSDLFAEIHGKPAAPAADVPGEEWQEAKALRGYGRRGVVAEDDDSAPTADIDQIVAAKLQSKNFRMEPKRRRFGIGTIIAVIGVLALLGGGAYAAWMNRAELIAMVDNLVSAAPSKTAESEPAAMQNQTPATPSTNNTEAAKPAEPGRQVAALDDGSSVNNKFNQRLMADGTEVDSGPAAMPGTPTAEGKSVSEQNVASTAPAPPVQAGGASAETPPPNGPSAAPQQVPAGASEKMFLYEERIGQSSPTAIQGGVAWSVQHEAGQGGKQESTVQANVTVPERNLSALVTFKRNSDPSLPASHLVEIVFSLPPNFEGGSIDSVQRISMKRTEQDRGDPLIAVPAKITDDFHMIALNDYPDARKANLDLLSTRDWIDIPITYRNGRRALITMQKGPTGIAAFNTAIKEWAALGDVSTSQ